MTSDALSEDLLFKQDRLRVMDGESVMAMLPTFLCRNIDTRYLPRVTVLQKGSRGYGFVVQSKRGKHFYSELIRHRKGELLSSAALKIP